MSQDKDKDVVDFGDSDYAAKIASVKGARVPVGGTPMPPMPRFDHTPPDRHAGVQSARPSVHSVLPPDQREQLAQSGQMIQGVGSAYVVNQPAVAVPTQAAPQQAPGGYINPPRPEGAGLRPETVKQLEKVAEVNSEKEKTLDDEIKDIDDLDGWETDEFGNRVRSLINNKKRRDEIEKRCAPLAIEELITLGEVRQRVPVLPGKVEPTYRSTGGNEDLFIKKLMSAERGSEQYIIDLFSLMNLVLGLHSLNGKEFPSHLDKDGEPEEKLFRQKMKIVGRMPLALLADLSVNYVWFTRRVQKLFVADNIKGF